MNLSNIEVTDDNNENFDSDISLPNMSIDDFDQITQLKSDLQKLRTQLDSAHQELENLVAEKYSLQTKLQDYEK